MRRGVLAATIALTVAMLAGPRASSGPLCGAVEGGCDVAGTIWNRTTPQFPDKICVTVGVGEVSETVCIPAP